MAVVETAQNGGEKKTAGEGFHEMKVFDSFQALQQADQIVARCASVVQLKSSSGKKCARIVPKFTVIGGYGLWNWKAPRVQFHFADQIPDMCFTGTSQSSQWTVLLRESM